MDYNIFQYGAVGDGIANDTIAIQSAINDCNEQGGGRVLLSDGIFLTGTLYIKSNVELHIDINASLLGSSNYEAYRTDTHKQLYRNESHMDRCLIFCKDADNIAFTGRGTIDGQGELFPFEDESGNPSGRPMLLRFLNCSNIKLTNLRFRNPASWTNAFIHCTDIWVQGIDIRSRVNFNGDGLDFDGCQNVFVSDCKLDCSDDCICLQASDENHACKYITITNTIMCSHWAGIRIGLLSCGDIENVTVTNCIFRNIHCSGLKIQSAEGGALRNMLFSNLIMENVQRPIFVTLNHHREHVGKTDVTVPETGIVEKLQFNQIVANGKPDDEKYLRSCIIIDGIPNHFIKDIAISNLFYTAVGGGLKGDAERTNIPHHIGKRAECFNYKGSLPAYGMFTRHVRGLRLTDINIQTMSPDERESIYMEDCTTI